MTHSQVLRTRMLWERMPAGTAGRHETWIRVDSRQGQARRLRLPSQPQAPARLPCLHASLACCETRHGTRTGVRAQSTQGRGHAATARAWGSLFAHCQQVRLKYRWSFRIPGGSRTFTAGCRSDYQDTRHENRQDLRSSRARSIQRNLFTCSQRISSVLYCAQQDIGKLSRVLRS